jgi:hypothetical protein
MQNENISDGVAVKTTTVGKGFGSGETQLLVTPRSFQRIDTTSAGDEKHG